MSWISRTDTKTSANTYVASVTKEQTVTSTLVLTVPYTMTSQPASMGRCIIASVAYGSNLADEVQFLRSYRDDKLLQTLSGSQFMTVFNRFYYSFSPAVAKVLLENPALSQMFRFLLYPLIAALRMSANVFEMLRLMPEAAALVSGMLSSFSIGVIYIAPLAVILELRAGMKRRSLVCPRRCGYATDGIRNKI